MSKAVGHRVPWLRSSQTTPLSPSFDVAAVAAVDVPSCSSPRAISCVEHFRRQAKTQVQLPTPQSPTMIRDSTRAQPPRKKSRYE